MPMKPKPGESQSDFSHRCVPEMMSDGKRDQDQAVAICLDIWRNKDKALAGVEKQDDGGDGMPDTPDPDDDESRADFMDRCIQEVMDDNDDVDEDEAREACEISWENKANKDTRTAARVEPLLHKTNVGTVSGKEFILSDSSQDRMGDIIMSDGWDITAFKLNPIALFNHNPNHPIGKWSNLRVENGALRGHLDLAPEGISPRIDEIRRLIEAGILQAVSVGFRPTEYEPIDKKNPFSGCKYTKQELIETSLVSVPANPNALAVAKSLGVTPATLDLVFAKHGNRDGVQRQQRETTAKHGETSRNGKGSAMTTLAQRILDLQQQIANKVEELEVHITKQDDTNVSDTDLEKTNNLNAAIAQLRNQHAALVATEKSLGNGADDGGGDRHRRQLVTSAAMPTHSGNGGDTGIGAPIIIKPSKKDWEPLDYLVHAGVCHGMAKIRGTLPDVERVRIYGDDEAHKVVLDWTMRAASAPALTTVTGWAAELVQQVYADMMALLLPQSIFPRLSAKGLSLSFGRAGKILLPTRSRTPTIAGSFVGEGMAIPVRQGAFTSQTFIPKKMAVITTWTREMGDHSIPAIEGVLRQAIQEDTAISLDSVLLDANPATTIRPAGILNGVAGLTPTAGGGLNAVIGDIKQLVGGLVTATYGNLRSPTWLMNPADLLTLSLVNAPNTGIFPFKEEIGRGTFNNIPVIDSATVPVKTVILIDAADFVVMQGDNMRFELSDQATLHMEDTAPADLVSGSPGTVASPQRSLFQTDSLALRMVFPINWSFRRTGMVSWMASVTW
jgi:HK97 family phage prohead protease